jgi:hypothetical protein
MVCRGGGIWFSKDGISSYNQITDKRVYPAVKGHFEDPVIWKTNIQYHMIVNDWLGRIAYYLRSKDGVKWKVDAGEAYLPGITKYKDGTNEDWFKYERIKMLQDGYGRAIQANFAVIDTVKWNDLGNDRHSSKNISIPLTVGRQIEVLNRRKINSQTKTITVKIKAEKGFNPHKDMDIETLRFGASEEVNFGRGSSVVKTRKKGKDLVVSFRGEGNGITTNNFVGKLLGKTSNGKLLFGYARLPKVDYIESILSARLPRVIKKGGVSMLSVEVQNFGQIASKKGKVKVYIKEERQWKEITSGIVPKLLPFQKKKIDLAISLVLKEKDTYEAKVVLINKEKKAVVLEGNLIY